MKRLYRLVFVDDEPWALIGLKEIIDWAYFGFEVVALCESADEAADVLRETQVDAACIDIRMPVTSGFDLVSIMREERLAKAFVILSAYREFVYAHRALTEGALYYLIKPFERAEVEKAAILLYEYLQREDRAANEIPLAKVALDQPQGAETALRLQPAAPYANCYAWVGTASPQALAGEDCIATCVEEQGGEAVWLLSSKSPLAATAAHSGAALSPRYPDFANIHSMVADAKLALHCGFTYAKSDVIVRAQRYLAQRHAAHIAIPDVAHVFYLSEVYLSELFKKHTGKTILQFVKDIRMHLASDMLRNSTLSIKEIAGRIGYDDPSYFGRLFKRERQVSPEAYRRHHQHAAPEAAKRTTR